MNLEPSRFFMPKRHVRSGNSPSGANRRSSTDVLNTSDQPSPARKVRDNQKSSIVNTGVGIDTNGNLRRTTSSPRHQDNTKNRLFGAEGDGGDASPRRCNDTWRSNFSFADANGFSADGPKKTPKKRIPSGGGNVNPITGSPFSQSNGTGGGTTTPHKNGVGTNGYHNGHHHNHHDHDDVLTVVMSSEGKSPVAVLNGHHHHQQYKNHGDEEAHQLATSTPRRRAAQ